MGFKIQPGTSASLCGTCREALVIEFADHSEVRCHSRGSDALLIRGPVLRCNDYDNKTRPSKWDMEKIAWVITTDKSGKAIGFTPPRKAED